MADLSRSGQDVGHSRVGVEGLALDDAELGQLTVEGPELVEGWLGVDDLVQGLPVTEVVLPLHRGEIGAGQLAQVDPGRVGPYRCRLEGVHLDGLDLLDGAGHVIAPRQRPQQHQHAVGGGCPRVGAVRYLTVVPRPADDVRAAVPGVGAGQAHVDDPALVQVIGGAHQGPGGSSTTIGPALRSSTKPA